MLAAARRSTVSATATATAAAAGMRAHRRGVSLARRWATSGEVARGASGSVRRRRALPADVPTLSEFSRARARAEAEAEEAALRERAVREAGARAKRLDAAAAPAPSRTVDGGSRRRRRPRRRGQEEPVAASTGLPLVSGASEQQHVQGTAEQLQPVASLAAQARSLYRRIWCLLQPRLRPSRAQFR